MTRRYSIAGLLCFVLIFVMPCDVQAQEVPPGEVLPELSQQQRMQRALGNLNVLVVSFMAYAREHEESVEEVGHYAGTLFAESWPEGMTMEGFLRGMNANWQMYRIETEVLEVEEDYIRGQRTRMGAEEAFAQGFGHTGFTLSDFETFFEQFHRGVAEAHGLAYSETVEDGRIIFTISVVEE